MSRKSGNNRAEHLFALEQAFALHDVYNEKVLACDIRTEAVLKELSIGRGHSAMHCHRHVGEPIKSNGLAFDARPLGPFRLARE